MAQKIQLRDGEDALLQVEGQAVGGEDGEQRAEVGPVLLKKTPSSSKKEKTNSRPIKILSLSRWKACAAFLRPKAMNKNSHNPNGVAIAVFWMSSSAMGI